MLKQKTKKRKTEKIPKIHKEQMNKVVRKLEVHPKSYTYALFYTILQYKNRGKFVHTKNVMCTTAVYLFIYLVN